LSNDELLRPTLSEYRHAPALYNSTGFAVSAFFGGPVGAVLFGLFNSRKLSRLPADLPVFVALGAAAFLVIYLFDGSGVLAALGDALGTEPPRTIQIALRALALGCFGAIYFLQRNYYRAGQVSGAKPLPAWLPGIIAVVLGSVANIAFVRWILAHH
jgi:hypothetical protein